MHKSYELFCSSISHAIRPRSDILGTLVTDMPLLDHSGHLKRGGCRCNHATLFQPSSAGIMVPTLNPQDLESR